MATAFFISPFKPLQWQEGVDFNIDIEAFASRLRSQWADIETYAKDGKDYLLWWIRQEDERVFLQGGIQKGRQVISLEGGISDIVEFSLWYRAFTTPIHDLYFFNDNLSTVIALRTDTTRQQLQGAIGVEDR